MNTHVIRKYRFRGLPCTNRYWCVVGKYANHSGGDVLEWCDDEEDANAILLQMQGDPQFICLRTHDIREKDLFNCKGWPEGRAVYVDIQKLAKWYGVENLRFFYFSSPGHMIDLRPHGVDFAVAVTDSNDRDRQVVEGRAIESRYKLLDGYKVQIVPLDNRFSSETFYQVDFESLSRSAPDIWYVMVGDKKYTFDWE